MQYNTDVQMISKNLFFNIESVKMLLNKNKSGNLLFLKISQVMYQSR